MKLRNKKTGAIYNIEDIDLGNNADGIWIGMTKYNSLAELNEEWEDYEEPKEYYAIERANKGGVFIKTVQVMAMNPEWIEEDKQSGNYFETKEEAEKAVEKLKAWKRLRNNGFTFKTYQRNPQGTYDIYANWDGYMPPLSWMTDKDLNLLFGGEE